MELKVWNNEILGNINTTKVHANISQLFTDLRKINFKEEA